MPEDSPRPHFMEIDRALRRFTRLWVGRSLSIDTAHGTAPSDGWDSEGVFLANMWTTCRGGQAFNRNTAPVDQAVFVSWPRVLPRDAPQGPALGDIAVLDLGVNAVLRYQLVICVADAKAHSVPLMWIGPTGVYTLSVWPWAKLKHWWTVTHVDPAS